MTNETETIIESLQPFIEQITAAPLPSIPGAGGKFYQEIAQIRIEANGRQALHRHRLSLTDYEPEMKPILPDQTDAALRRRASERRASEARQRRYLDQSSVPEVAGE